MENVISFFMQPRLFAVPPRRVPARATVDSEHAAAKPKRNTKLTGDISELRVLAALVEAGYHVWLPYGENHRADVVMEDGDGRLYRVQVKTGRLRGGVINPSAGAGVDGDDGSSSRAADPKQHDEGYPVGIRIRAAVAQW